MLFYIDPGTGSMLFTVLIGLISAVIYGLRGLFIKLRYSIGGGKKSDNKDTIPFVIYSDDKRYYSTFKGICDEFESRKINLTYLTQSQDDPIFNEDYKYITREFIGEGNKAFTKLNFLKADVLLSTTPGLDVYQWKRSKDVKYYVHIFHSTGNATLYKMFGLDFYDSILIPSINCKEQIQRLENLRNIRKKDIQLVGVPYLDNMKERLDSYNHKIHNTHKITVLLAPSWGPFSILNKYGSSFIDELIKTGYKIVIRPHPQSFKSEKEMLDKLMLKYPDIEWNKDTDNFDILNESDILISDYSSVVFDFALVFNKPIIYADTSFNNSQYDAWWLGEDLKDMWKYKILSNIGKELTSDNIERIGELIEETLKSDDIKQGIAEVREIAWPNVDKAAKLTADYLIKKQKELTE